MTKILLTNSTKLFQSNLIRKAVYHQLSYSFVGIDYVDDLALGNLYVNKAFKFYLANMLDTRILTTIIRYEKPDVIIHQLCDGDGNDAVHSLLKACQGMASKLIYLSDQIVYGGLAPDATFVHTEDHIVCPTTSKAKITVADEEQVSKCELSHNIVRIPSLFGPRQHKDELIPRLIRQNLAGEQITLTHKGQRQRDWLHTSEAMIALFNILEKGEPNQIYNLSAGWELSDLEIAQHLCNLLGGGHDRIQLTDAKVEGLRYAMDGTKLRELGWKPKRKFKERLEGTVGWYRSNPWALK
jgi:dTDP-D-glucose 4,6-dehydratase